MKEYEILDVHAIEVIDSGGYPTLEVTITLKDGITGCVCVPGSDGKQQYGAVQLRDGDKRRSGLGVLQAVTNVNTRIADKIIGMNVLEQVRIDRLLVQADGTDNKRKYGANAIAGVSFACAKAAAKALGIPLYRYLGGVNTNKLPLPMANMLCCNTDANQVDIRDFLAVATGADSFSHAVEMLCEVYNNLKKLLSDEKILMGVGKNGGLIAPIDSVKQAFDLLTDAIEKSGYHPGDDIMLSINAAANELLEDNSEMYGFPCESKSHGKDIYRNAEEMVQYYEEIVDRYPVYSIVDGMAADDIKGWKLLTYRLGNKVRLAGNTIFEMNKNRLLTAIDSEVANSVVIKCSEAGTVTEVMEFANIALRAGYKIIISRDDYETQDTFISDLAVALCADNLMAGALCRSECCAKYNRMLEVEDELNKVSELVSNKE